jgi:AcrR family transcriptional regulator
LLKVSRKKQKAETRQKLMDATAAELAAGRSFDTLSLREIAKLAGIAPTSFYRHFHDMGSLGFALIEEHGEKLLALMHHVREQASGGHSLIRTSVETLFEYNFANQGMSRMILLESMSRHSVFHSMVAILFTTGITLLNRPVEDRGRHIEAAIVQLRMIMRGAEAMGREA